MTKTDGKPRANGSPRRAAPDGPSRSATLCAATVVIWSLVGMLGARLPWHAIVGPSNAPLAAAATSEHDHAIVQGALGLAAFFGGYTLLARGPLLARSIVFVAVVSIGALAHYAWRLYAAARDLADIGRTIGAAATPPGFRLTIGVGFYVAAAASLLALVAAASEIVKRRAR
jgi:hypothetical protein